MPKTPEEKQEDSKSPTPEATKGSTPRVQPRYKGSVDDKDDDELFNDMPV